MEHRNWQKRIHIRDASYFITTNTYNKFPYFKESVFCDLFVENLRVCRELKQFKLYGWVICYDHVHLMIQPRDKWNISEIMKSLKENVSCSINRIMDFEGATTTSHLQMVYRNKYDIFHYQKQFIQKYPTLHTFPKFQWQKSYHDHYTRNESDFIKHMEYIQYNPTKHGLPSGWQYVFTNS